MSGELTVRTAVGTRVVQLRYSNRAICRVGTLDRPLALTDFANRKRGLAALSQWLWACLDGEDAKAFETYEDVADALKPEQIADAIGALKQAIEAASSKNAASSTPQSPSPVSS